MTPSRRQYLGTLAAASLALAGCSDGGNEEADRDPEDAPEELQLDGMTLDPDTPIQLYAADTENLVAEAHGHGGHWHRAPLSLTPGEWASYEVHIRNFDREPIPLGSDERYQLSVQVAGDIDFVDAEVSGDRLDVIGRETGGAELILQLVEDGEPQWTPPNLPLSIS